MNKIVSSFFIITFLLSCSHTEFSRQKASKKEVSFCKTTKVSLSDIHQYINERRKNPDTKSLSQYSIEPICRNQDTLMFLVNYKNGWELLSGDSRLGPVLIWCESGNISLEELYSNPAQSVMMEGLSNSLDSLIQHPHVSNKEVDNPTRDNPNPPYSYYDENGSLWVYNGRFLAFSSVIETQTPLSGLKWGQGTKSHSWYPTKKWNITAPYDDPDMLSHCYAGCGQVACAQTLYYLHQKFGKPDYIYKTSYCPLFLQNNTDVVYITDNNTGFSLYGDYWYLLPTDGASATSIAFMATSTLMLEIGKIAGASYGYDGTGTYASSYQGVFDYYGYNSIATTTYNESIFRSQIYNNKLPIVASISGQRYIQGEPSPLTHVVVIEGYKKIEDHYTYVYCNGDSGTMQYQYFPYTFTYDYVAVNWGYDGAGEYNSTGDVIWNNISSTLTRSFSGGYDTGTIYHMVYGFSLKQQ